MHTNIKKTGAPEATSDEPFLNLRNYHDIISFSGLGVNSRLDEFYKLYAQKHSLRDISVKTGVPISSIRSVLVAAGISLRNNRKIKDESGQNTNRSFTGAIPYDYCLIQGQLVPDTKEQSIIQLLLQFWRSGMSFNAIKQALNDQNIPSKLRRKWNDKTVKAIIKRESKKHKKAEES